MGLDQYLLARENHIIIEIGKWRKANQIHRWFVENVADGDDDSHMHEVTKDDLLALRACCTIVSNESVLIEGMIKVGQSWGPQGCKNIRRVGHVVENPEIAMHYLPPKQGFFFGTYEIDEIYIGQVKDTIAIIDEALALPDDVPVYYESSW